VIIRSQTLGTATAMGIGSHSKKVYGKPISQVDCPTSTRTGGISHFFDS
jgi:hypothetical protein